MRYSSIAAATAIAAVFGAWPSKTLADTADKLSRLVGYTIVDVRTIKNSREGNRVQNGFNGCTPGRVIVFTDNKTMTCVSSNYHYASGRSAVILAKPSAIDGTRIVGDARMVVNDEIYEMRAR